MLFTLESCSEKEKHDLMFKMIQYIDCIDLWPSFKSKSVNQDLSVNFIPSHL